MRVIMTPRITVVGSLVADLCVWVAHFPRPNETLPASRFELHPGGKGFNQAVGARRFGADVAMVGRVGDDAFAPLFFDVMAREGMDGGHVARDAESGTSLGIPMIDPSGDNSIVLVSRANERLDHHDVEAAGEVIDGCDLLMLQLEVPVETSLAAAQRARASGAVVVLNPAPARTEAARLLEHADWLIPNEVEAAALVGRPVTDPESALIAAGELLERGVGAGVIVTLGSQGAACVTRDERWRAAPFSVTPVDPTGAGDAFCGVFSAALASGLTPRQAVRRGCAAGALSATLAGAEPSLPRRAAIDALLAAQPGDRS